MARAHTIGNGNLLVGIDERGEVRDLYFPLIGHSNHISGASGNFVHRVGVFSDGRLSWLSDHGWRFSFPQNAVNENRTVAVNDGIGVALEFHDAVHNETNVFLRRVNVRNLFDRERALKLFFSQQFRISESRRGDTAFFDPRVGAIIHYKGHVVFLINAFLENERFTEYNIGLFGIEGKEGTFKDAEDGRLEKNPIEHGSVDSVLGLSFSVAGKESRVARYFVAASTNIPEVHALGDYVIKETVDRLIESADDFWRAWISKDARDLSALPPVLRTLYERSLLIMRAHADNRGGIIASSDTDILHHGRDTYGYVWPRDAAMIAHAFDRAGYSDVARRYFSFIAKCVDPGGYLMHKYRSDGVLGSSWHPWLHQGEPRLPIQEDETATTIFMLWHHYERARDLEFIESLYNSFIEPSAQFMCEYVEPLTGLPRASYDLWEENYSTSTYTAASVCGALLASSRFAMLLGKDGDARTYQAIAERMRGAILTHLYDPSLSMFVKNVTHEDDGQLIFDHRLDVSSFHGPIFFGVVDVDDDKVKAAAATVAKSLSVAGDSRGFIRYEGDAYYRMHDADSPNPWVITTLWVAQYHILKARRLPDLKQPLEFLLWASSRASLSCMIPEQLHPHTRAHLSTAPLVWSHAEYVLAVDAYLQKLSELSER
jgi:GH15 family glucan-1,4-alpha-glucosidase